MTKRQHFFACLAAISVLAGCEGAPLETEAPADIDPQFAPGGIPGPPPWVIIPTPPGPPPTVPVPLPPRAAKKTFLGDIVEVGAGANFNCALQSDGMVFCWGSNEAGQLGNGSQTPSSIPVEVSASTSFARLFVGDANACGLTAAGEAYCWGLNDQGQVGNGSSVLVQTVPAPVAGGHLFTDLSIGLRVICGVATDGITYCWGSNTNGVLGTGGRGGFSNVPVAVSNSDALAFTSVDVGFLHACGLDAGGSAYCWGFQSLFGNGTAGTSLTPTLAAGGRELAEIEAGNLYSCGIEETGDALCWGTSNTSGEMGIGSLAIATIPTAVAGGHRFASLDTHDNNSVLATTCGITTTGAALCWGSNERGQLGAPSAETCIFQTSLEYDCSTSPLEVSGGNIYAQAAVGIRHVCAVDTAGRVWCWGANDQGQLGDGTMTDSPSPVRVRRGRGTRSG